MSTEHEEKTIYIDALSPTEVSNDDLYMTEALRAFLTKLMRSCKVEVTGVGIKLEDAQFEGLIEELKVLLQAAHEDEGFSLFIRELVFLEYEATIETINYEIGLSDSEKTKEPLERIKRRLDRRFLERKHNDNWIPKAEELKSHSWFKKEPAPNSGKISRDS
jgi:hypothetical protein